MKILVCVKRVPMTGGRIVLTGDVPDPASPPAGCRFRSRCSYARAGCEEPPALRPLDAIEVRCHFAERIRPDTRGTAC